MSPRDQVGIPGQYDLAAFLDEIHGGDAVLTLRADLRIALSALVDALAESPVAADWADVPEVVEARQALARAAVVSPPDAPSDESLDAMEAHAEYAAGFSDERGLLSGDVTRLLAEVRRLRVSPPDAYEQVGWCWPNARGPASDFPFSISTHLTADVGGEPVYRRVVRDENENTK